MRDTMGDAIMAMLRMTTPISVEMVSHMDQFFRDNHFNGPGFGLIDSLEIDEHRMNPLPSKKDVGAAVRRRDTSTEPSSIHGPVSRYPERIIGQTQLLDILLYQRPHLRIARVVSHQ
jgi:hypothetical protein